MKTFRKLMIVVLVTINTIGVTGCWNYREINKFSILAGMAVDKDKFTKEYILTGELIEPRGATRGVETKVIQMRGESIFNGIREMIEINGKRVYWAHNKIMIVSEEVAREGLSEIMDVVDRDAEIRGDVKIFVSKGNTANKILYDADTMKGEVVSYKMADTLKNQKSVAHYPDASFWDLTKEALDKHCSSLVPFIGMDNQEGTPTFRVEGSGVIVSGRLKTVLNGMETKSALFLRNQVQGGFYVVVSEVNGKKYKNTLEIFDSKTKLKPEYKNDKLIMNINVEINTGIIELEGDVDFISKNGRQLLQEDAEEYIRKDIEKIIEKAQRDLESDIFGFSKVIKRELPKEWKRKIEPNWEEKFEKLDANVQVKINIKDSGLLSKPIKEGD